MLVRLQYFQRGLQRTRRGSEPAEHLQLIGDYLVRHETVDWFSVLQSCEHDPTACTSQIDRLQHQLA